jgi:hypothetical protein
MDAADVNSYSGTGTAWRDIAGPYTFTLTNGPTYSTSNSGILSFDGTNDYGILTGGPTAATMSLSCWFRTSSQQVNKYILAYSKSFAGGQNGYDLTFQTGQIGSYLATTGGQGQGALYTKNYYDGVWHMLTSTYNGSVCTIYFDGESIGSVSGFSGSPDIEATKQLTVGSWANGTLGYANASIAQVQVYTKSLSATEVLQNFNALRGRFGA